MTLFKRISLFLFATLALSFAVPSPAASAYDPFGGACQSGGGQSAVCKDRTTSSKNPLTGTNGTIMRVVNIISFITGAAAVIIIIISGIRFVTAGGNADGIAGARRAIIYAAVGLVVIAIARTLVGFVLGRI